jgi:hypothetical protein
MRSTVAIVVTALICFATLPVRSKDSPRIYQTGKLLDLQVQNVSRGVAVIGSMAAPIPGFLYVFQIQCDDLAYFARYSAGKLSYKPDWDRQRPYRLPAGQRCHVPQAS